MSEAFPAHVIEAAQQAQKATGCLASVALAQWALESAYGKCPCAPNNYWGIKWYQGCKYPFRARTTHEYVRGKWITVEARFQAFPDLATGFIEHGKLLMKFNGPYKMALPFKDDWQKFIQAIAPIYATDPHYAEKLITIVNTHALFKFDLTSKPLLGR
jgi:flagellar protein FlgJ